MIFRGSFSSCSDKRIPEGYGRAGGSYRGEMVHLAMQFVNPRLKQACRD